MSWVYWEPKSRMATVSRGVGATLSVMMPADYIAVSSARAGMPSERSEDALARLRAAEARSNPALRSSNWGAAPPRPPQHDLWRWYSPALAQVLLPPHRRVCAFSVPLPSSPPAPRAGDLSRHHRVDGADRRRARRTARTAANRHRRRPRLRRHRRWRRARPRRRDGKREVDRAGPAGHPVRPPGPARGARARWHAVGNGTGERVGPVEGRGA